MTEPEARQAARVLPLDPGSERRLAWLTDQAREIGHEAARKRRKRRAEVILEADESGTLTVRLRPELHPP